MNELRTYQADAIKTLKRVKIGTLALASITSAIFIGTTFYAELSQHIMNEAAASISLIICVLYGYFVEAAYFRLTPYVLYSLSYFKIALNTFNKFFAFLLCFSVLLFLGTVSIYTTNAASVITIENVIKESESVKSVSFADSRSAVANSYSQQIEALKSQTKALKKDIRKYKRTAAKDAKAFQDSKKSGGVIVWAKNTSAAKATKQAGEKEKQLQKLQTQLNKVLSISSAKLSKVQDQEAAKNAEINISNAETKAKRQSKVEVLSSIYAVLGVCATVFFFIASWGLMFLEVEQKRQQAEAKRNTENNPIQYTFEESEKQETTPTEPAIVQNEHEAIKPETITQTATEEPETNIFETEKAEVTQIEFSAPRQAEAITKYDPISFEDYNTYSTKLLNKVQDKELINKVIEANKEKADANIQGKARKYLSDIKKGGTTKQINHKAKNIVILSAILSARQKSTSKDYYNKLIEVL